MLSPFVQPNAARACSNAALRAIASTSPGASWPTTTMRRFAPDRCARAAIGQAAAPPIKVTNSRRFIRPTSSAVMNRGRACSPVLPTERIAYLGRGVRLLRCGISNQLISQMGQKRRFGGQPPAFGLPRTTDVVRVPRHVSKVPTRDSCTAANCKANRSLVRTGDERWRHVEADCLGGFEVYHQLELRGLLHGQIRGSHAL